MSEHERQPGRPVFIGRLPADDPMAVVMRRLAARIVDDLADGVALTGELSASVPIDAAEDPLERRWREACHPAHRHGGLN